MVNQTAPTRKLARRFVRSDDPMAPVDAPAGGPRPGVLIRATWVEGALGSVRDASMRWSERRFEGRKRLVRWATNGTYLWTAVYLFSFLLAQDLELFGLDAPRTGSPSGRNVFSSLVERWLPSTKATFAWLIVGAEIGCVASIMRRLPLGLLVAARAAVWVLLSVIMDGVNYGFDGGAAVASFILFFAIFLPDMPGKQPWKLLQAGALVSVQLILLIMYTSAWFGPAPL